MVWNAHIQAKRFVEQFCGDDDDSSQRKRTPCIFRGISALDRGSLKIMDSKDYQELNGIDGEPVEFEWNIFPGHTTLDLFREIQRNMAEHRIKPEKKKIGSSS